MDYFHRCWAEKKGLYRTQRVGLDRIREAAEKERDLTFYQSDTPRNIDLLPVPGNHQSVDRPSVTGVKLYMLLGNANVKFDPNQESEC